MVAPATFLALQRRCLSRRYAWTKLRSAPQVAESQYTSGAHKPKYLCK